METKIRAYAMEKPGVMSQVWVPMPEPGEHEVRLKLLVCGTCASEYLPWLNCEDPGRIMGHEGVGIVDKVGERVTKLKVGDRVTGMLHQCFAEYTIGNENELVKVPDALSDEESVGEPLAMLMSGVGQTPLELGQTFAIIGTGYMGLGFLQLMRAKGAGKIIAIDVRPEGLANAKRFGADELLTTDAVPPEYIVDVWDDGIFDRGIPVVAEVTGNEAALQLAGDMTAVHGHLSIAGYHQGGMRSINMALWNWKAIHIANAHERRDWRCAGLIQNALTLIQKGFLNTKDLMTNVYGFDEINKAYYELKHKPDGYIKGVIRISNG